MKKFFVYFISAFIIMNIFFIRTNAQFMEHLHPFIRSLASNQNVYKTQDSLDLIKVYNKKSKIVIRDSTTIYRIILRPKLDKVHFIRYTVLNDVALSFKFYQVLNLIAL